MNLKPVNTYVAEDLHWRLSNKCKYHEVSMQNLILHLLLKVDKGEIDFISLFTKEEP